jgi:hypothetical protein
MQLTDLDHVYSYLNDVLKEQLNVVVRKLLVKLNYSSLSATKLVRDDKTRELEVDDVREGGYLYPELDCCGTAVVVYDEVKAILDDHGITCYFAV